MPGWPDPCGMSRFTPVFEGGYVPDNDFQFGDQYKSVWQSTSRAAIPRFLTVAA